MPTAPKQARMTVDLGDQELYRAIRHAAIESGKPLRAIVAEALRKWLDDQEEMEDVAAIRAVKGESTVSWEQMKADIRAAEAGGE